MPEPIAIHKGSVAIIIIIAKRVQHNSSKLRIYSLAMDNYYWCLSSFFAGYHCIYTDDSTVQHGVIVDWALKIFVPTIAMDIIKA